MAPITPSESESSNGNTLMSRMGVEFPRVLLKEYFQQEINTYRCKKQGIVRGLKRKQGKKVFYSLCKLVFIPQQLSERCKQKQQSHQRKQKVEQQYVFVNAPYTAIVVNEIIKAYHKMYVLKKSRLEIKKLFNCTPNNK